MIDAGFFAFGWLGAYPNAASGSGVWQIVAQNRWWLAPALLPLLPATYAIWKNDASTARLLVTAGVAGIALILIQGFAIDHRGWTVPAFGPGGPKQTGMGY